MGVSAKALSPGNGPRPVLMSSDADNACTRLGLRFIELLRCISVTAGPGVDPCSPNAKSHEEPSPAPCPAYRGTHPTRYGLSASVSVTSCHFRPPDWNVQHQTHLSHRVCPIATAPTVRG